MEVSTSIICILYFCLISYVRSQSIIEGLKGVLDGVSNLMDDLSFGVKQVRYSLNAVEEIVKYAQGMPCEFNCPSGKKPKINKYHKPIPAGCGSYGIQVVLTLPLLKDSDKCCDKHDVCYSTCLNNKTKCDTEFAKCLYKNCEKQAKLLDEDIRNCKGISKLFHMGVNALGCSAFKSSQAEACICSNNDEL